MVITRLAGQIKRVNDLSLNHITVEMGKARGNSNKPKASPPQKEEKKAHKTGRQYFGSHKAFTSTPTSSRILAKDRLSRPLALRKLVGNTVYVLPPPNQ